MNDLTLHYLYDPLCGWCYGASPLLAAAREVTGLDVRLHGGGMMTDANRQPVGAGLRHYVMPHDLRIAQLTGQPFGKDYFDGLLRDTSAVFDSAPPTAAVLAAEALDGLGAAMLARIQRAHYVEGRRIAERPVLLELGAELGLGEGFAEAFDACSGEPLRALRRQSAADEPSRRRWLPDLRPGARRPPAGARHRALPRPAGRLASSPRNAAVPCRRQRCPGRGRGAALPHRRLRLNPAAAQAD